MNHPAQISTIGDITTWYSGGTPSRAREDFWNGNIPWISAFTLKDTEIRTSDQFLNFEAVTSGSRMAPLGSTLLLVRGSALHNEIRAGMVTSPVAFNQDVKALVPKRGIVPKYLTHVIRANEYELLKLVTSSGNTAGVLDTKVVQAFEIYLPDEPEQLRLVEAFDDSDHLTATLERFIAKKQAIKQGMMQELLTGRTRLPGFSEPWRETSLREVLKVRHGRSQHNVEEAFGKYPILATGGEIGRTNMPLYSKPSVLIGRKGTIDRPRYCEEPFWTVDTLFYTEIYDSAVPKFLYYQFLLVDWRSKNEASGVPSLSSKAIENVQIQMPGHSEQHAITDVLTDVDLEIELLHDRLAKAKMTKQGMMQELLTGHTRLQAVERTL